MKRIFILPLCLVLLCTLTVVSLAAVCDINADSSVNALDLQFMINAILGASTASTYDLNQDGQVNALDLQTLANVVLGAGTCPGSGGVVISAVSATNITTSGASITWTTNVLSDSQVQYGLTQTYGSQTTLNPSLVTSHSQALSGLQSNRTYNYRVLSKDTAGNLATSPNVTFTTAPTTSLLSYSTNFDGTENPISENGVWSRKGLDWTDVRTSGGIAYGTQTSAEHGYNDSYALLSGFSPNQTASAVVHLDPQIDTSCTHEVELLLRFADSAGMARGYEINMSFNGGYAQIMRWNGPIGDFTEVGITSYPGLKNGDVFKASIIGNVITMYVNDQQIGQATDNTFSTGNPGIGFFRRSCGSNTDFALTSFSVTNTN